MTKLHLSLATGFFAAALCLITHTAWADEEKPVPPIPEPKLFTTEHRGQFNGTNIAYQVVAGETYLRDIKDDPTASIFSFAYTQKGISDTTERPITFVWNGGPGSASVWLHMSGMAPVYVDVPSDGTPAGAPPYNIKNAPDALLDVTDMVFVDPVGTGFSRALGKHEPKEFWGNKQDAESMALFIKTWLTKHNRWNSPLYLLGESFGTTRAAYVANILQSDMKIMVNGLVFVSQALDYQGSSPYIRDNIISYITYIPTMAATALYHGKVQPAPEDKAEFLQQSRDFATNELLPGLFAGNRLSADSRAKLRDKLAYFTGLSPDYIERVNLRVNAHRFAKELLRDQGVATGLLDSRYTRDEIDDVDAGVSRDAASDGISSAFIGALQHYMRSELKVDWERRYLAPADPDLYSSWQYSPEENGEGWEPRYVNTAPQLSSAMRINPNLNVLVASGYYDLVTPFFDAEYTLNRHDIDGDRIHYTYYEGGHMMYVNGEARDQWLKDTREFIQRSD